MERVEVLDEERHICKVANECKYGVADRFREGCNYYTITKRLRTSGGGHEIIDGRCDLYEPRTESERPGWIRFKEAEYVKSQAKKKRKT